MLLCFTLIMWFIVLCHLWPINPFSKSLTIMFNSCNAFFKFACFLCYLCCSHTHAAVLLDRKLQWMQFLYGSWLSKNCCYKVRHIDMCAVLLIFSPAIWFLMKTVSEGAAIFMISGKLMQSVLIGCQLLTENAYSSPYLAFIFGKNHGIRTNWSKKTTQIKPQINRTPHFIMSDISRHKYK